MKSNFLSNRTIKRFAVISAAALLVLEIFIFNFNAWLPMGGQTAQNLPLDKAVYNGFEMKDDGTLVAEDTEWAYIDFYDINTPVYTLRVNAENGKSGWGKMDVNVSYTDKSSSELGYRRVKMELIENNSRSQITRCNFSGDVNFMRLSFHLGDNDVIIVKNVSINEKIPFNFSPLRVLTFYFFAMLVYVLFNSEKLNKSTVGENKNFCLNAELVISALFMVCAAVVTLVFSSLTSDEPFREFFSTGGNQITKEIVDAFCNGQVTLLEKPSEELLALNNPYDWGERLNADVNYLWDHCLYNGEYYSYYGIAPVILLFLPYHLLTGFYFPTNWAVLLFSLVGIFMLSRVYTEFVRKWFPKLPLSWMIMGLIMIQCSSGIWMSLARPLFYEIAISAGFMFVTLGVYCLQQANTVGRGEVKLLPLCLSAVFLSLAVLSRPTLAVYCVAALLFLFFGIKKYTEQKGKNAKTVLKYLVCALLPYAVFGGAQMAYNYIRFGSPLDFGIQYSLTINDFTVSQYHSQFTIIGLFAYLFNVPQITPEFPFVSSDFQYFGLNGYYFVDDAATPGISIGMFFRALPMFGYLLSVRALKTLDKVKRCKAAILGGVFCVIMPLVIILSVWESGYAVRYNADISWQLLIGALAVCFTLYLSSENAGVKRIATGAFVFCTVMCIIVNGAQLYNFMVPTWVSSPIEESLYTVERLFEFWR